MSAFNSLPKGHQLADRYTVFRLIGSGRSSAVYEALDNKTQTSVALKILDPFVAQDPVNIERFLREARIIRHLDHPGVIKVFDVITEGEFKFIVMEYFPSKDGAQKIKAEGRLSLPNFMTFAKAAVEIVDACHKCNVVHRDIKPQNILFSDSGQVKLVDFGISRMNSMSDLTKTGTVLGTPEYMPPEAFVGSHSDPRSDIYSLGAVFYEFLSGYPPFNALSLHQIMSAQLKGDIKPLRALREDVPSWLDDVIGKCLRPDMVSRYQSCGDLLTELAAGEKALAQFDKDQVACKCLSCGQRMLPGLAFCHACGKFQAEVYQPGENSIILHRAERPIELEKYLVRTFPDFPASRIRLKLKQLPVLLIRGVSDATAEIFSNELYNHPVRVQTVRSVPKEFALTRSYYVVAALGLLPLVLFPALILALKLGVILLAEAAIFAWFARKTIAVINLRALKARKQSVHPSVIKFASRLSEVGDLRIQAILGSICASFQNMSARGVPIGNESQATLEAALNFGIKIGLHSAYLKERSVGEIKKSLEGLELKLKHSSSTADSQSLVQQRANLMQEYKNYRHVQDMYAEGVSTLLAFHEHVKQRKQGPFTWEQIALVEEEAS